MIKKLLWKRISGKEDGSSLGVDLCACLMVFIFSFGMILAYLSYTQAAQMKMQIDNVAKEYIYKLEETGMFDNTMKNGLKTSLEACGCTVDMTTFQTNASTQVDYGKEVRYQVTVSFPNPLYQRLGGEVHGESIVTVMGLKPMITYTIERRSTSRW